MAKKTDGTSAAKTIVVEQTGSPIRRPAEQRATLIGLGVGWQLLLPALAFAIATVRTTAAAATA